MVKTVQDDASSKTIRLWLRNTVSDFHMVLGLLLPAKLKLPKTGSFLASAQLENWLVIVIFCGVCGVRFPRSSQFGVRTTTRFGGRRSTVMQNGPFLQKCYKTPSNGSQDGAVLWTERFGDATVRHPHSPHLTLEWPNGQYAVTPTLIHKKKNS